MKLDISGLRGIIIDNNKTILSTVVHLLVKIAFHRYNERVLHLHCTTVEGLALSE